MLKLLTVWITTICGKFLKRRYYQATLPASWEIRIQVKKPWLEPDMEQSVQFSSFQSLSCVQLFATPWTAVCQTSLSITSSQSLLKLMSIELVMPPNHLILCHPPLLLPSIFPSISVFSNESVLCIRWPKYWSFSFSISTSNEHSGLISFRMDWLDLLAVQGTMDWFKLGKGVHQGCILSPCLFNLCAEYIMRNARLDEAQAGINIVKRSINNLRYADDTTLIA